jgi:hypothetical protein
MSIFDIFSQAAPVPAAPVAPTTLPPGSNIPAPNTPAVPGQGVVPVTAAVPATPVTPESPLDTFKDLWEPVPVDPNATVPAVVAPLTAEQVQTAVDKANFSQGITQEQLAAITAGGDGAQEAFSLAMNSVAKQVMVQSTMVNSKLTERAVEAALEKQSAQLPQLLRAQANKAHLSDTSELFANPAIRPVVEATQAQILQKYPNATPLEVTTMTQEFIQAMGSHFQPEVIDPDAPADWSNFLE